MHNRTKLRKARKAMIAKLSVRMDPVCLNGLVRLFDLAGELLTLPKEIQPGTYRALFENDLEIIYTNKPRYFDKHRGISSGLHDGVNPYMSQIFNAQRNLEVNQENLDAFCENSDLHAYAIVMRDSAIAFNGMQRCQWAMIPVRQPAYGALISFPEMRDRSLRMAVTTPLYNLQVTKNNVPKPRPKANFTKPDITWIATRAKGETVASGAIARVGRPYLRKEEGGGVTIFDAESA